MSLGGYPSDFTEAFSNGMWMVPNGWKIITAFLSSQICLMKDKKEEMSNLYEYNYQLHSTIIYITCATYFFYLTYS